MEMDERLETVLTTIYLLFNEGYYSFRQDKTVRKELCLEAMRLCTMLVENGSTNKPQVNALLSLMCFHASRLEARMDENGMLILYDKQNTSLWNEGLIAKGGYFLRCAGTGDKLSRYHLEAAIAWWHTQAPATDEKWQHILQLYDQLLQITWSPMAALNRIFALSKVAGKTAAIPEAESLNMSGSHLYFTLLGELYTGTNNEKAKQNFQAALALATTHTDKDIIRKKMEQC
jgi:predicted RNA polymerase sigma factor